MVGTLTSVLSLTEGEEDALLGILALNELVGLITSWTLCDLFH